MKLKITIAEAVVTEDALLQVRRTYAWWVACLHATDEERRVAAERVGIITGILEKMR